MQEWRIKLRNGLFYLLTARSADEIESKANNLWGEDGWITASKID